MKWSVFIVLAAILLSAFLPPTLPLLVLHGGVQTIGELDVCHSAAPAISGGGDMPFIGECPCKPLPAVEVGSFDTFIPAFVPSLYSTQNERPPKA